MQYKNHITTKFGLSIIHNLISFCMDFMGVERVKEKLGVYLIVGYLFKSSPLDASIQAVWTTVSWTIVAQKSAHHRYIDVLYTCDNWFFGNKKRNFEF